MKLVVTQPFADRKRGDEITSEDEIEKALADHPEKVVRVNQPPAEDAKEA